MKRGWGPTPQIVMTRGVLVAFSKDDTPQKYLDRHWDSDWGNVPPEDAEQNDQMKNEDGMVLSAYETANGTKIWIITDPGHEVTTILLPEEY